MEKKHVKTAQGRDILCARHGKRMARVVPGGIELWCKCSGGHPVFVPIDGKIK